MNTNGVVAVRRRLSRAEAERLVSEYEQSGLRRKEFCEAHGLNVFTLDAWRKRIAQPKTEEKIVPIEIVEDEAVLRSARQTGSTGWNGRFRVVLSQGLRIEVEAGFIAYLSGLSPWPHGRSGTAKSPKNTGNQELLMSSVSIFARSHLQRGRSRRRYRGTLPLTTFDGRLSSQSRELTGFQPAESATSTVVNCKTTTLDGHIPLYTKPYQPFNTHRASIVERFSPIRF